MRLKTNFFNRPTLVVARHLLGKYLCRRIGDEVIRAKIIETEAYCGQNDLACHASKGLTPRTKIMFGPPGYAYVYLVYGMYHCLNVVTEKEGYPAAILIRGAQIVNSLEIIDYGKKIKHLDKPLSIDYSPLANLNGPGILCRELMIDKKLNGTDLSKSKELWFEDRGDKVPKRKIKRGKRINVDYAGKWKDKPWRFFLE